MTPISELVERILARAKHNQPRSEPMPERITITITDVPAFQRHMEALAGKKLGPEQAALWLFDEEVMFDGPPDGPTTIHFLDPIDPGPAVGHIEVSAS